MAEGKNIVNVYRDWINIYEKLSDEEAGRLAKHFFRYINDMNPDPPDRITELCFEPIKEILDNDKKRLHFGSNHWNWKNGITSINALIRNSVDIKNWRKAVFERDKFTCQRCFKIGGILHTHHIKSFSKYPELRFDVNNGITYCKSCHNFIHSKNNKNG